MPTSKTVVEWGHRLAADFPGRGSYRDRDNVRLCTDDLGDPCAGPCSPEPTVNGFPQDHLWRVVLVLRHGRREVGEWRTEPLPGVSDD